MRPLADVAELDSVSLVIAKQAETGTAVEDTGRVAASQQLLMHLCAHPHGHGLLITTFSINHNDLLRGFPGLNTTTTSSTTIKSRHKHKTPLSTLLSLTTSNSRGDIAPPATLSNHNQHCHPN